MGDTFLYCPVCQIPLKAIHILPDLHVTKCISASQDNTRLECPKGVHCLSRDIFHYRDYSHKLLADYRSSADFVPPDLDIKPSPKKRKVTPTKSPRKQKTPKKVYKVLDSFIESDSGDEVLVSSKKPCRGLSLNHTNSPQNIHGQIENLIGDQMLPSLVSEKSTNSFCESSIVLKKNYSKLKSLGHQINCPTESQVFKASRNKKCLVEDTKVKEKRLLKKIVPFSEITESKISTFTSESLLEKEKNIEPIVSESSMDDFDDIIPGSRVNKDLLKTVKNKLLNSESSNSSFGGKDDTPIDSLTENEEYVSIIESPSDFLTCNKYEVPQVTKALSPLITANTSKLLSSSSDSDLPLASLIKKNIADKFNIKDLIIHKSDRANKMCSLKKTPVNIQLLSSSDRNTSSGESDSGKSTGSKNSSKNSILKGKEVAGKMLRSPKKTTVNCNGRLLKANSEVEEETDSGKSSGAKDSSFKPSDRESSSKNTDSALSATSSEHIISSISSTYTSSEEFSLESQFFSDESYNSKAFFRNRKKNSPLKQHNVSLSGHSSSSDISKKEKCLFGKNKKSSPSKLVPKSLPTDYNKNIYRKPQIEGKKEWQSVLSKMINSSFPSDLKIDSEDSLTVASSCSGSDTSRSSIVWPLKQCPFYKKIPDTSFAVDAFQYWNIPDVKVYFLSHFHSDHYIGLKKSFAKPIYCSQITANLVQLQLRVNEKWLRVLKLNEPQVICGVEVTALDANHCPGSMMFLFSLTNGQNYLHVGDFRATPSMRKEPMLQRISIAKLFLDTTYCSPQYCFPTQEEVIGKVVAIVKEFVKENPLTLVVCGSYTIGKEKVFLGIAEALDWRVWARPNKQRVFACLNDPRINSRLSLDPRKANVHVLPMANIQITPLKQHLETCSSRFSHVLAFKPTGWELNSKTQAFKVTTRDTVTIYGVPYSEHSSFTELRDFVHFLEPREVVPTVNVGSAASRQKMSKHFEDWLRPQSCTGLPSKLQTKMSQFLTNPCPS